MRNPGERPAAGEHTGCGTTTSTRERQVMEGGMKVKSVAAIVTIILIGISALPSQATEMTIEPMRAELETRFALSALPPALRDIATVYLLDPKKGYQLSRQGASGVTCLVERTVWEWVDFRNDIYIPLCYDAVGTKAHLRVIMDTAALRAQGMSPVELKAEIEKRTRARPIKLQRGQVCLIWSRRSCGHWGLLT